ncbi:MAG: AAA family ATPase [Candidatus Sericytochromatia bacterium]
MIDLSKQHKEEKDKKTPKWLEELRKKYLSGQSIIFILHSNVLDLVSFNDEYITLKDFLVDELLTKNKDISLYFDESEGLSFGLPEMRKKFITAINTKKVKIGEELLSEPLSQQNSSQIISLFERAMEIPTLSTGIILGYAETLFQSVDRMNYLTTQERANIINIQRWANDPKLLNSDNLVILITENISEINEKIVKNPQVCSIEIPMPDYEERLDFIKHIVKTYPNVKYDISIENLANLTAGLRKIQIQGIFREANKTGDKISYEALNERKKKIIETECFDLVEILEPKHKLDSIGGMDYIKSYLKKVLKNIHSGNYGRVPMGMFFVGPMGTGKTYMAEAFASESAMTCLRLKNFVNSRVGATEANLEKIFSIVKVLGSVLIILDEIDRALGDNKAETDGGTSSKVYAKIKAFMSDTTNRGKILWVIMSNRPDKLDVDLKRSGRFDSKIPFFYPQNDQEVESLLTSLLKKNKINFEINDFSKINTNLINFSGADIEAIILNADGIRFDLEKEKVTENEIIQAIEDFIPNRNDIMIEFMELLAVFECSSRSMLPEKYKDITSENLNNRIREIKSLIE